MRSTTTRPKSNHAPLIGALLLVDAATFFLGAAAHLGGAIPLGVTTIHEPRILPATIVESVAGLSLAVGGGALLSHRPWAWAAALAGQAVALGGVLLGMAALAAGRGPRTELNDWYHRLMVVVLSAGIALVASRTAGRRERGEAAR